MSIEAIGTKTTPSIDSTEIDRVSNLPPTFFKEHISFLAARDQETLASDEKDFVLYGTCADLISAGNLNKAQEIANTVSHLGVKHFILTSIARVLINTGKFGEAQEFANKISGNELSDKLTKSFIVRDLVKALIKSGNIDQAIEIVKEIPKKWIRIKTLQHIIESLIKSDIIVTESQTGKIIDEIPYEIKKEKRKEDLLNYVAERFKKNRDITSESEIREIINGSKSEGPLETLKSYKGWLDKFYPAPVENETLSSLIFKELP